MSSRGRIAFKKYRGALVAFSGLLRRLPSPAVEFVWRVGDVLPGHMGAGVRYAALRASCNECGDNVYVGPYVVVKGRESLDVGSNVSIHAGCYIDATGGVAVGNDVSIAHHSSIVSANHTWSEQGLPIRDQEVSLASVSIGNDVWIGCGARILAGTRIGPRSVVAAGAVVARSVEGGCVVAGVPARPVKRI